MASFKASFTSQMRVAELLCFSDEVGYSFWRGQCEATRNIEKILWTTKNKRSIIQLILWIHKWTTCLYGLCWSCSKEKLRVVLSMWEVTCDSKDYFELLCQWCYVPQKVKAVKRFEESQRRIVQKIEGVSVRPRSFRNSSRRESGRCGMTPSCGR